MMSSNGATSGDYELERFRGPNRPEIIVYYAPGTVSWPVLRDVLAGLEEEGVPANALADRFSEAATLAALAARESQLEIGIGIGSDGAVAIGHSRCKPDRPLLVSKGAAWVMGSNAARLVKGIPLRACDIP